MESRFTLQEAPRQTEMKRKTGFLNYAVFRYCGSGQMKAERKNGLNGS